MKIKSWGMALVGALLFFVLGSSWLFAEGGVSLSKTAPIDKLGALRKIATPDVVIKSPSTVTPKASVIAAPIPVPTTFTTPTPAAPPKTVPTVTPDTPSSSPATPTPEASSPPPTATTEVDTLVDLSVSEYPNCEAGHVVGRCSLREAINHISRIAQGYPSGTGRFVIHVPAGTYVLSLLKDQNGIGEDLNANGDLDVNIPNNDVLIIQGDGNLQTVITMMRHEDRLTDEDRIMQIIQGNIFVRDLRIYGGHSSSSYDRSTVPEGLGGGIKVDAQGHLTLTNVLVDGNSTDGGCGGGIANDGNLTMINSTLVNNQTIGDAIHMHYAETFSSTDDSNFLASGGGLCNRSNASVVLDRVSVYNNQARRYGGGIYNDQGAHLRIMNSTIATNSARGGFYRIFSNTSHTDFPYGEGGGIYNSNGADVTCLNCTIAFNHADVTADGISNGTSGFLSGATSLIAPGTVNIQNSIVLYNNSPRGYSSPTMNCQGPMNSRGNNISDASCPNLNQISLNDHRIDTASEDLRFSVIEWTPVMEGIQYFYPIGNTFSPAFNGVRNLLPAPAEFYPSMDQRNTRRPQGIAADVGAYEMPPKLDLPDRIMGFLGIWTGHIANQDQNINNNGPFVTIQSLTVENHSGEASGGFRIINNHCDGQIIGMDVEAANCTYTVQFAPRKTGTITADLIVRYQGAGGERENMERRIPMIGTAALAPQESPSEPADQAIMPSSAIGPSTSGMDFMTPSGRSTEPEKTIEDKGNADEKSDSPKSGK